MKVLVISDYREQHAVRPEAEVFIGLAKMGVQVQVMTYGNSLYAKKFVEAGIEVIDFHPEKKFNRAEIALIRNHLINERIDILHLFNSTAVINGIQAANKLPVKVVLYRGYTGHIHWYDPSAYFKYLHPRVDKIMCNSLSVEENLQRALFFGQKKTVVISKGHNVDWYAAKPVDLHKTFGIPKDAFVVVNVANYRKVKGTAYLLEAMKLIPRNLPVHLLLVGRGMDCEENLQIIGKGTNKDKVHFLGFLENPSGIVAASHVFVLASIKAESVTKAVAEAMAQGKAPVITALPGNKELVVPNESGLLVPPKDANALANAIITLYQNPDLRERLGQNARQRIITHFNIEQTTLKVIRLYDDLLK